MQITAAIETFLETEVDLIERPLRSARRPADLMLTQCSGFCSLLVMPHVLPHVPLLRGMVV